MADRPDVPAPTDAELDVLRILWDRGPSTVREVYEIVFAGKEVGYTTVLKQMQVMHRKGLVKRSERFRSHVYEASQPQARVQRDLVQSLVRQAFGGSAASLVQSALGGRKVSAAERPDIREVLEKFGGKS